MLTTLRRPYLWIGVAVSVGALALSARSLRIDDVVDALTAANYLWLFPALAVLLIGLVLRARRWQLLFHPVSGLSLGNLFGAMNVGYMLNSLLPFRVGELGRAYVIGKVEDVGWVHALTTIVVERLLDVLLVIALLLILLPFVDEPSWATGPALVLGVSILVLATLLAAISRARRFALHVVEWLLRPAPERLRGRLRESAEAALDGFATLGHPPVLLRAGGWSVIAWAFSSLYMYFVLLAFDLELTYAAPLLVMVATALGMIVPSSPGAIGVYHAIAIETLTTVFAVERADAAGFALVSHAIFNLVPIILGMAFLWSRRESWRDMLSGTFSRSEAKL